MRAPVLALLTTLTLCLSAHAGTFTDTFSPSASPLWNNSIGNWTTASGKYFAQNPSNNPATITVLPFDYTDATVSINVNSVGDGGIWLRSDATGQNGILLVTGGNGYGQGVRGGPAGNSLYWHIVTNGSFTSPLSTVSGLFAPGDNIHLDITVVGNTYSAFLNGSNVAATTLTTPTFTHGRFGLYDDQPNTPAGGSGAPQSFSNFSITAAEIVPEPSSLALLSLAAGLTCLRRRKKI